MKQISTKLKNYTGNVNIIDNGNLQKRILGSMLWSLGILSFFYVLLLGNMIFNIIERKSLETQARNLSNEVGMLELDYFGVSQKVDLNLAHSLGFKETKANFATRKALGSIKVATNEI